MNDDSIATSLELHVWLDMHLETLLEAVRAGDLATAEQRHLLWMRDEYLFRLRRISETEYRHRAKWQAEMRREEIQSERFRRLAEEEAAQKAEDERKQERSKRARELLRRRRDLREARRFAAYQVPSCIPQSTSWLSGGSNGGYRLAELNVTPALSPEMDQEDESLFMAHELLRAA